MADQLPRYFAGRPPWSAAPGRLRRAVEAELGARVTGWAGVRGGMSPGPAVVLSLSDGRRVFAKAIGEAAHPGSHRLYEQEADALAAMPAAAPAARLVAAVRADGWFAVVTEFVPGTVAGPPWNDRTVAAVARACDRLAACPAPPGIPPAEQRAADLDGWSDLAAGSAGRLSRWEAERIDLLTARSAGWREWIGGTALTHLDLRGDNALVGPGADTAVLIDWGFCAAGAPWIDRALLAADVAAAGHVGGPERARRQAVALLAGEPMAAARFVIAQAGMWRRNSTRPPHPGMPAHRRWQRTRAGAMQPLLDDLLNLLGPP